MKKVISALLTFTLIFSLISGIAVCSAAPKEKEYYDYGSYVLLGDSVASGWSDVEDRETRFVRVEGSYGAHVADDLGVEYHPMACIGFRTVEMRYIFEDDYEGDRFLFYSISDEEMERRIPEIRKAVAEAGLITLNVGGNDWGSFVGWHVYEEMDKFEEKNEEFMKKAEAYLQNAGTDENTIDALIDIAALCGALPDIIKVLPVALKTGFESYIANWNYMIEDIYALNPDVTLLVIGMFDNMVQNQETADKNEAALLKISLSQTIVDYANKPMIEGAEKYGYTFIDTTGTICEQNHPSAEGHRYIADKILEALPAANFPYADVDKTSASYKAIEYMYLNDIMAGVSDTEFDPDSSLSKAALSEALCNITGESDIIESTEEEVNKIQLGTSLLRATFKGDFNISRIIKGMSLSLKIMIGGFRMNSVITRAEGAEILMQFIEL